MDHGVSAKVIITLLDLYVFAALFFPPPPPGALHKHTPPKKIGSRHAEEQKVFSDERAAPPGVEFGG